ncbi:FmdB family zinc ribbon protein [Granulicella arctica]|uniref:Putative FmdB family regulatory protein n=1 Tax=Granulicella arctica TaxID=940613 RepID=A0A7Y9TF22_9BACT|nr:zinc ribbon domain-containing protein [Granulicella arctica]NYF78281.1 putative FmdB family regulatory protein [Granulicella arctica]
MPLYEYECTACHKRTEKIQKFSDPEITICPSCSGPLERVISAPAISFKGGGWYADGYGSVKPAASGESKSSETKSGETKTTSDSASKSTSDSSSTAAAPAAPTAPATAAPAAASSDKK